MTQSRIAAERAKRLRQSREASHLTVPELARRLAEVQPATLLNENKIRNLEYGKVLLRREAAEEIAGVLRVDPAFLLIDDPSYPDASTINSENGVPALQPSEFAAYWKGVSALAATTLHDGAVMIVRELLSIADFCSNATTNEATFQEAVRRLDYLMRRLSDLAHSPSAELGILSDRDMEGRRHAPWRGSPAVPSEVSRLAQSLRTARKHISDLVHEWFTAGGGVKTDRDYLDSVSKTLRQQAKTLEQIARPCEQHAMRTWKTSHFI